MADVEYLREEQRRQNYLFTIVELGGRLAKGERIRRLIPIFEQGRFLIPDKLWYQTLAGRRIDLTRVIVDELLSFPVASMMTGSIASRALWIPSWGPTFRDRHRRRERTAMRGRGAGSADGRSGRREAGFG
jgi:hypothetical protein